jgi:hypothetical protein
MRKLNSSLIFRRGLLLSFLAFSSSITAQESAYQIGRGFEISDFLTLGGYFSTEYELGEDKNAFLVDDLAILAYGDNGGQFSYLLELESIDVLTVDFENDTSETNWPATIERLYGDYKFSDYLGFRVGKQISPIGYWNLQPINVLRETTSNPRYSRQMFPKFITGVSMYGFTPFDETLSYQIYGQNSRDMDQDNLNIAIDKHYGVSLEKEIGNGWKVGGSIGRFRQLDQTKTRYAQLNSRYDTAKFSAIAEGILNYQDTVAGKSENSSAFYLQGEYRVTPQHALIARAEYYKDGIIDIKERVGILGYSFRPVYPVSLKFEYQWHADSNENQFVSSFSVLF